MFFIDFHAPCGVLGVEQPDTFSPELLAAIQVFGASNINTAPPLAPSLVTSFIAYAIPPDYTPPRPQSSNEITLRASYFANVIEPNPPRPK
jgi:hypothetical protein